MAFLSKYKLKLYSEIYKLMAIINHHCQNIIKLNYINIMHAQKKVKEIGLQKYFSGKNKYNY